MDKRNYCFSRNPLVFGKKIEQPPSSDIKQAIGLWSASLEDALKLGGDITRMAISAMHLRHDRKYVVVDVKTHMLMPGMWPALPGWHTDGAPRDEKFNPQGLGAPNQFAQELPDARSPRYHLLVTGQGCLTEFIQGPLELPLPQEPTAELYALISKQVREKVQTGEVKSESVPSCQAVEFDWHDLHSAVVATKKEWRYMIRVTETDYLPPCQDINQIIRIQQQAYITQDFGW